ncbi:MAG: hypothetical protein O7E52_18660 [Candidatus Poribacteria bacterium]|nr:hypothetical protein [Candidatus Poribacteria bacterium]
MQLRIGVVGAGQMGMNHLERLSGYDDVVLQALAEVDTIRREHAGNRFGFVRTFHLPFTLRVLGVYGVGTSETILITETGCDVLTQ